MSCDLWDIGCHVAAYFDPLLTWWGGVGAFIRAWWWVAYGAVMLLIGAHLGPGRTYGIVIAGVVAIALRFWPQPDAEPDYETGEPLQKTQQLPPEKRRTLKDILRGR